MKVYLSEYINPVGIKKLLARGAEIVYNFDHIEDIDAMIVRGVVITREMMQKAKRLKVIGKHGVGYNSIDIATAKELGIRVIYTPGMNSEGVAEMAIALMMDAARFSTRAHDEIRSGECKMVAESSLMGRELYEKTVALVGLGNVSRRVARILNGGFDMKILGYDKFLTHEQFVSLGIEEYDDIDEMLKEADFISVSVPLTPETKDLISEKLFSLMKKTAILVNTSRGGTVNEEALFNALKEGQIAGAGSDVFVEEPPKASNPLFSLPNFVGTPHLGGNTHEALYRCAEAVVDGILDVLDGKIPRYPVV
ncbi:MAG: hydroxyacid dehydrogenase [Oscillospiraceae bacterium]